VAGALSNPSEFGKFRHAPVGLAMT
jgi:hypothetical protein